MYDKREYEVPLEEKIHFLRHGAPIDHRYLNPSYTVCLSLQERKNEGIIWGGERWNLRRRK